MGARATQLTNVMIAALVAGLVYLNWYLADMTVDVAPIAADRSSSAAAPGAGTTFTAAGPVITLGDLPETTARPLFHPTRRPFVAKPQEKMAAVGPPSEAAEPEAATPSGLSLAGVMATGSKGRRALLRPEGQTNGTWVEEGGDIGGWRVQSIDDDRVVVEKSGNEEELVLDRAPKN